MISCRCPGCGRQLSAKDHLAGRTVKCSACGAAIQIRAAAAEPVPARVEPAPAGPHIHTDEPGQLPPLRHPARLDRQCRYLICGDTCLAAVWENNGRGWMLNTDTGLISAARNPEQIPSEGNFKLVELKPKMGDAGLRLEDIAVFQLAERWALTNLGRGDDPILTAVTGRTGLSRAQKDAVRDAIHHQYMREVWEHSDRVMAYLADADHHAHGTR
jgi:hypothetical protein